MTTGILATSRFLRKRNQTVSATATTASTATVHHTQAQGSGSATGGLIARMSGVSAAVARLVVMWCAQGTYLADFVLRVARCVLRQAKSAAKSRPCLT